MPRILSINPNQNLFKSFFESFKSLDRYSKTVITSLSLMLLATPFIIGNLQIFNPHGQQKENLPNVRQQRPGQEKERKRLEKKLKTEVSTNGVIVLAYNLKAHPENKDKIQQQLITAATERKQEMLELFELDPASAKEHILPEEVLSLSIIANTPGVEVESKVSLSGTYSTIHKDDFDNPENSRYFNILNTNNTEYYLYSDKDFPKLEPNSSVFIEGYQLDNKVLVTLLKQGENKVLGITDFLKPQKAFALESSPTVQNVAVIATTFTDSAIPNPYDMNLVQSIYQGNPGHDVVSYYSEASFSKTTINPSFYGPYQMPISSYNCNSLRGIADAAIKAADPFL